MFGNVLMFVMALVFLGEAVRALRTGEINVKRSVIQRANSPLSFSLLIGSILLLAAVGFDLAFGLGLLMRLVGFSL